MSNNPAPGRKVVLGLGNILNRDEGAGVRALEALRAAPDLPTGWDLLDGGVLGYSLLPLVEECDCLILLDAADAGLPAGGVVELAKEQIPLFAGIRLSQHQVTFQEVLGLAAIRSRLPERLHLVGIQPADISIGLDLSGVVEAAVPEVVWRAMETMRNWEGA